MGKHVLSALVENHPGVLSRVAGLFSRRGYNIESLSVGETEDSNFSRMTIVMEGSEQMLEQMMRQMQKLVEVVSICELKPSESVYRELALVKVHVDDDSRAHFIQTVDIFRGKIVDHGADALTVEMTGDGEKIDAFLANVKRYGILESVRTGLSAMARYQ
jgi:acetolactate synthase I/III small subunit